jgi:hypothetical protein
VETPSGENKTVTLEPALSSKDYFANRDPILEAVINVIEDK